MDYNRSSPLRSKSHSRSPARQAQLDDNQTRMRKSQERIASILGLDRAALARPAAGVGALPSGRFAAQNQSISQLLHSRREGSSNGHPYKCDPIDRASLERQPHHAPSIEANPSAGEGQFATSMVRQSLADLKNRLNTMRQEKQ